MHPRTSNSLYLGGTSYVLHPRALSFPVSCETFPYLEHHRIFAEGFLLALIESYYLLYLNYTKSKNQILTELPSNAGVYGQHFFCITVSKTTSEKIAELLNYINVSNNASVKKDNVNSSANKWITALINNKYDTSYPTELQTTIKSKMGVDFNFISKSYLKKVIPYDTTVRSIYSDDFYVRTWTKPAIAPAICEDYSIFNVQNVKFGEYGYSKGKEHSKWAISVFKYINCFADLNHCPSQDDRGGNIVCFENEKLHEIMKNAVVDIDSC